MSTLTKVRARFGGHAVIDSYGTGSPVYMTHKDELLGTSILNEYHPSAARELAAALLAAADDAEGKVTA